MIYAKIIHESFENHRYHVALHFYGPSNICKALSQQLNDSGMSPLSFIASKEFVPKTDTIFVLQEEVANQTING